MKVEANAVSVGDVDRQYKCMYFNGKLRMEAIQKMDTATANLLLHADEYIDEVG